MTQLDTLTTFLGYVTIVAVTAERVVEMCKPMFGFETFAKLFGTLSDDQRKVSYYALAAITGAGVHLLSGVTIPYFTELYPSAVIVGLLVSGGSGIWHDLLGIVRNFSRSTITPVK